ncbi:MAG: hypothetical protein ACT4QC_23195 [Planctomycetaceae bacterium]
MDRQNDAGGVRPSRRPCRGRLPLVVAIAAAMLTGLSGCQIVIGVLMMLKGLPTIESDFTQKTKKELSEKNKRVVILSSSTGTAQAEDASLDFDFVTEISRRLRLQKINVVDSHEINRYIDDNGQITDETDLAEIGPKFKADYIILFKFDEFGYREPNSVHLYRGHARGKVVVVELKGEGADGKRIAKTIYKQPFDSKYPVLQPIQSDQESASVFRQRYVAQLSEELARLFYDHRPGEDM